MARYAICAEGAASMRALAKQLYTEANAILESSTVLEAKISAVGDGLVIYESEILGIVQQGRNTLQSNREDILNLAQRVLQKADEIEELVSLTGTKQPGTGNNGLRAGATQTVSNYSKEYSAIVNSLNNAGVEYRPIQLASEERTASDIVNRLSGGDLTQGSCSSLALAYAGNKAGYDVLDFRDGESRSFFSSRASIQQIAELPGVNSLIYTGTNDVETANQLLSTMTDGKEYYLATGGHAAIVRKSGNSYQYLELQHPSTGNGWHTLNNYILDVRFGCSSSRVCANSSFLIDVDSLSGSQEFQDILGYINTDILKQRKGGAGHVR